MSGVISRGIFHLNLIIPECIFFWCCFFLVQEENYLQYVDGALQYIVLVCLLFQIADGFIIYKALQTATFRP